MLPLLHLLMSALALLAATDSASVGMEQHSQCRSLCASCQSLKPARINQICSLGLLTGCSCPENALNLTSAVAPVEAAPRSNCPQLDAGVGYCPHGQQTDSDGCPLGLCRPPPGCPSSPTSPSRGIGSPGCRLFCPAGYQTDVGGCPICRCRCFPSGESASGTGGDEESRRCSASCAALGATAQPQLIRSGGGPSDSSECSVCVCRLEQAAATTATQAPCLLRCPNSCGPYGYADGESRDDRGCVRDCSCRCPASQGRQHCPGGESCLRWEIDRFGCQVCSACSQSQQQQMMKPQPASAPTGCVTKSSLHLPNAMDRLCPPDCLRQQFSVSEDSNTGCLTCTCSSPVDSTGSSTSLSSNSNRCPSPEPRCSNSCGPHGHLRDSQGCLLPGCACSCPDLNACITSCSRSSNFTVARDAYGCHACHCSTSCPTELRCSRSCGLHGYETDTATGCQSSCQCRCPRRSCGCFYGSRQDLYGCDTCECVTASEYLQLLPF